MTYENYSMHQAEINGIVDRFYVPTDVKLEPGLDEDFREHRQIQRPGRAPRIPDEELKPEELAARELKRARNREAAKRVRARRIQRVQDLERELDSAKKALETEKTENQKLRQQLKNYQKTSKGDEKEEQSMINMMRKLSASDNTQVVPQAEATFMTPYGFLSPTLQFVGSPLTAAANMPTSSAQVFAFPQYDDSQDQPKNYTQLLSD